MQYFGRNIVLRSVFELAAHYGIDDSVILRELDLDRETVYRPGGFVASDKVVDAVEYAAIATGRRDFGVQLGLRTNNDSFGAMGVTIAHHSDTLAKILTDAASYALLLNSGIAYTIIRGRDQSRLRFQVLAAGNYPSRHYTESMMLLQLRFCRLLFEPEWHPAQILLEHQRSAAQSVYERAFQCSVAFNQDMNAIVAPRSEFERRISVKDTPLYAMVQSMLGRTGQEKDVALPAKVAQLVRPLLPSGTASAEHVAGMLKLAPRTFQRHLAGHGTSFKKIVNEARVQIVDDYITRDGTTGGKLAELLGFSEPSAASRFLRDHFGLSARQLKAGVKRRASKRSAAP